MKRPSKYHNQRVVRDGKPFASILEARRYDELQFMIRAGIVKEIQEQPRYLLQESFRKNGVLHRAIYYVADFLVTYADGHQEIEDVKGRFITPEFRIKQKLFEKRYPDLTIRIVGGKKKRNKPCCGIPKKSEKPAKPKKRQPYTIHIGLCAADSVALKENGEKYYVHCSASTGDLIAGCSGGYVTREDVITKIMDFLKDCGTRKGVAPLTLKNTEFEDLSGEIQASDIFGDNGLPKMEKIPNIGWCQHRSCQEFDPDSFVCITTGKKIEDMTHCPTQHLVEQQPKKDKSASKKSSKKPEEEPKS